MGFINDLFSNEAYNIWVLVGGLAITIVAIIIVVWLLKFAFNASRNGLGNRMKRLGVITTTPVDNKRQLVIVRRDNKEHLIMIGGPNDVVIETGIDPEESVLPTPVAKPKKQIEKTEPVSTAPVATTEPFAKQQEATPKAPIRQPIPKRPMQDASTAPRIIPAPEKSTESSNDGADVSNVTAIDKLRELGKSAPDSTVSTLKYPGILRPVTRHKGVDSEELDENNEEQSDDSDNLSAQEAPKVELAQGADGDTKDEPKKPTKRRRTTKKSD